MSSLRLKLVPTGKWPALNVAVITFLVVFAAMASLYFLDDQFAFGRSVGFSGCAIIFGLLAAAVAISAAIWNLVLPGKKWSVWKSVVYGGLVLATSLVMHSALAYLAHRNLSVGNYLMQAKVEYFCVENVTPDQCEALVRLCPKCAKRASRMGASLPATQ